jgi:hypothetical protein
MATKHDWNKLDPLIDNLKAQGWNDTQIAKDLGIGRQTLVDHLHSRNAGTPKAHPSVPIHQSVPEQMDIPESGHRRTPEHTDPPIHQGTLEGHQEVMEDIAESVPGVPHAGIEGASQGSTGTPEYTHSTPRGESR